MSAIPSTTTLSLKTSSRLHAVAIFAAAVYLFVLPFGHVTALRNVAFLVAFCSSIWLWTTTKDKHIPLVWVFAAWFGIACLSLYWTHDTTTTLEAIKQEIIKSAATFFVFFTITRETPAFRVWATTTAACLIAIAIFAAILFPIQGPWSKGYLPPRGDFATMAVTILPLLVGFFALQLRKRRFTDSLIFAATIGTLYTGFVTHSRAFWLGLLCLVFLGSALSFRRTKRFNRRKLAGILIVTVIAFGLASLAAHDRQQDVWDVSDRTLIYSSVIGKVAINPWLGTGFGHEADKVWYETTLRYPGVSHPHNIVLSYMDQLGVVGIALLAAIFLSIARPLTIALRSSDDSSAMLGMIGLAMLGAVFIKNNFDMFFIGQSLWLFFAHAGIYLGQLRNKEQLAAPARGGLEFASKTDARL